MTRFAAVVSLASLAAACSGSPAATSSSSSTTGFGFGAGVSGGTAGSTGSTTSRGTATATSTSSGSSGASGTTGSGAFVEAPHQALPLAIDLGGPIMATPNLVIAAFQNDPNINHLISFFGALVASDTYVDSLSQYGVQSLTLTPIVPSTNLIPSTYTDAQVRAAIRADIAANPSVTDAQLESQLFVFVIPEGTAFTFSSGGTTDELCTQAGGYHSFLTTTDGTAVVYAVAEECALQAPYPTVPLDAATVFLSHEIAEATTDPQFFDLDTSDISSMQPAYTLSADLSWFLVMSQGELADLCAFPFTYFRDGAGFLEQHIWSNAAATAGQDPCGNTPYFGVGPSTNFLKPLTISGIASSSETISGVSIPVGSTLSIPLTFFSSAAHDAWGVVAIDAAAYAGGMSDTTLTLSQDEGQNGEAVMVTVTVNQSGTLDGHAGLEGVLLYSKGLNGESGGSLWPILIQSP